MRAKVVSKPGIDSSVPSIREVGHEIAPKPFNGDPGKVAAEGGIPCVEYAKRVKANQGSELQAIFVAARVRAALKSQGYDNADIEAALEELKLA